jgi:TP901 family phage tail tape measure protein
MAAEKSIKYKLSMKDGTSSVLKKVSKQVKANQKSFRNLTDSLAKMTIIGTGVSRALNKIGQVGARVATETVGKFMEFEKGMAEVATITNLTESEMANLGTEIQKFSRTYAVDANDAAKALYMTISAGTDATNGGKKAFEVMGQAIKFGKAALVDASTSVDLMTTVLNSYGMEAEDATKVSDILFTTIKLGKTTGEELAGSMGRVTSIASAAGVSFEDLSGAMVMLTRAGLSTEEATTSLRSLIVSIVKPTVQAKEAIGDLGLSLFNEQTLKSEGGLFKVLKQLNEKAGESVGTLGSVIPNIRALTGALAAAGQQKDVPDILAQIGAASGNTDIALEKMTRTFAFRWEQLIAQFDSLKTRFGEIASSSDVLRGTMSGISKAVEGTIESLKEGGTGAEDFGKAIDTFIVTVLPAMASGFGHLINLIGGITIKLYELLHIFDEGSSTEIARAAVDGLSGSFFNLSDVIKGATDSAKDMAFADEVLSFTRQTVSASNEKLTSDIKKTTEVMAAGTKDTKASAAEWSSFEDNVNAAASTITKAGGMIPAISETASAIETAVHQTDNLRHQFLGTVTAAMNLRTLADGLGAAFASSMSPALGEVTTWLDSLFDRLGEWGTELSTTLQDAVAGWYTTKHELEVLDAARSQDIHAASASSAAAITNAAIAQIMPSLSAAATAALIATQGGAQVHAGLLPALLAAAAAQGAAFAAFADGGRVTSPTLALIGEAGDETIIPETRTGRARDVLSDLASRRPELFAGGSRGAGGNVTSNNINISVEGGGGGDEGIAERIADEVDRILGRRIS